MSDQRQKLIDLLQPGQAEKLPVESILPALALLQSVQSILTARLLSAPPSPSAGHPEEKLLMAEDVAKLFGIHQDSVYQLAKDEFKEFTVRIGRHTRFSKLGIERYLRMRKGI